ncbi:hypothetical protein DEIGR_100046 [Deinococcus grandis]|uniref:Uncharacterized protein n=1 Tax=Deinococcus grandis TaxID=57498 RepID=A0A100HGA5_9DEIO|nr:DUF5693 family protein [Deinococcus grandis]BBN93299.1 hypothetical protein DEGR_00320 [Deinococcus grandis]GAQ20019.1 hypothetical protein DEIGR_100046 [Deinococcus grandis]
MTQPAHPTPPAPPTGPGLTVPPASRHRLTPLLLGLILLSAIPALILAVQRVQHEQAQKTAALVMDYPAVVTQARRFGRDPLDLLAEYQRQGINGVGIYEDVIGNLAQRGEVYLKSGADLRAETGDAAVSPRNFYLRSLKPGVAEALPARYTIPTRTVQVDGQTWTEWPTDPTFLPVGPDEALIGTLKARGFMLVYRPYADDAVREPGADWPDVPFVIFNGEEVIGARTPELLAKINERLGDRVPALIEATPQRGLDTLIATHGAVRTFSVNPAWQQRLDPITLASKYNLAARERSMRLLYVRPYPTINETSDLLSRTSDLLRKSGVTVTQPVIEPFRENTLLRTLSLIGPVAALLLLGLSYPLVRLGLLIAAASGALALVMNRFDPYAGVALIAAVTFPALGLVLRRARVSDWFVATGLSLTGVLFVSALGATKDSVLGLDPFRGVGLTLLLPLLLVAASFLPRQDLRKTIQDVYNAPIKLGDILIMVIAAGVFALVFLRRGNATGASVSDTEAKIRQDLQDTLVRPRFKEMAGHPLGLVGLSGVLPGYFGALLILGGVVGQSSILNTFSHFHTPLLISAQRCFLGLGVGLIAGLIAIQVVRAALHLWRTHGKAPAEVQA